jgi:siroheme synthase
MPGKDFAPLCSELTASGVDEGTPCVLVSQATRPEQTMLRTSLRELATLPSLPAPAILIIGAAVAKENASELAGSTVVSDALESLEKNETTITLDEPNELSVR